MPGFDNFAVHSREYYLKRCREAEFIRRASWVELLSYFPEYQSECPCWQEFTSAEWVELLIHHPEWSEKCDMTRFTVRDWWWLVFNQQYFIRQCPCWQNFTENERNILRRLYPGIGQYPHGA